MRSKWVLYTAVLVIVSGCQSVQDVTKTEARLTTKQLDYYKIDCKEHTQLSMLESQRVSHEDYTKNALIIRSPLGWVMSLVDGTLDERYSIDRGARSAVQRQVEYQQKSWCS
mgnify:CR=1 FL=1